MKISYSRYRVPAPFALALLLGSLACRRAPASPVSPTSPATPPSAPVCRVTAHASTTTFGASGGSATITVTTLPTCSWSIGADVPWIELGVEPGGRGDTTVRFMVAANTVSSSRRGTIIVEADRLELTQDAAAAHPPVPPAAPQPPASPKPPSPPPPSVPGPQPPAPPPPGHGDGQHGNNDGQNGNGQSGNGQTGNSQTSSGQIGRHGLHGGRLE